MSFMQLMPIFSLITLAGCGDIVSIKLKGMFGASRAAGADSVCARNR